MKPSAPEADLTFSTPDDSGFPYVLFLCVLGSFLAHAGTFFLFQVVYPQRVTIPQPAPRVSLLTPSSPENVAILRWIEAEDPALVANDNTVAPTGLVDVHYVPSFSAPRTAPLGAPVEQTQMVRFPRAKDRLSIIDSATEPAKPPPAMPVTKTAITFSGALTARSVDKGPPIDFHYRAPVPVDVTTLLLGVDDRGQVRFTVLQRSSGDQALDELALSHLQHLAFAPAEESMTWGFATISWGIEAYESSSQVP